MRVLLVDPQPFASEGLARELEAMNDVEIVATADDSGAAREEARLRRPDLVIFDVETSGENSLGLAATLRKEAGSELIVLSEIEKHAVTAFEAEAMDYLLKPVPRERLHHAVDRARRRREEKAAHLFLAAGSEDGSTLRIPDRNGGYDLPIASILWVEAARDYAVIHTRAKTHILRATTKDLSARLSCPLVRVHRSFIVALAAVLRWAGPAEGPRRLLMSDGTKIPVGPSYLTAVREALRSFRSGQERLAFSSEGVKQPRPAHLPDISAEGATSGSARS